MIILNNILSFVNLIGCLLKSHKLILSVFIALLITTTNCDANKSKKNNLIADLNDKIPSKRQRAIKMMIIDSNNWDSYKPELAKMLNDSDSSVQTYAIYGLSAIGGVDKGIDEIIIGKIETATESDSHVIGKIILESDNASKTAIDNPEKLSRSNSYFIRNVAILSLWKRSNNSAILSKLFEPSPCTDAELWESIIILRSLSCFNQLIYDKVANIIDKSNKRTDTSLLRKLLEEKPLTE